jgi:hypothetical protein
MTQLYLSDVFDDVSEEADRAREKFGEQLHLNDLEWQSVLLEEVGEAAMLVTKGTVRPVTDEIDPAKLRAEITQICAVGMRWIRAIDERARQPERRLSRPRSARRMK